MAMRSASRGWSRQGYPGYITSAGWLGYSDEEVKRRVREAMAQGWDAFKLKVGGDLERDQGRLRMVRDLIGENRTLMVDANQVWEVGEAIEWVKALSEFGIHWIEEPTNPDDVLGHAAIAEAVAPVLVATGEHAHNRIMFKQFLGRRRPRRLPDRHLPDGQRQRERPRAADGRKVRCARLSPRRRRRALRTGAAPLDVRLHSGEREPRWPLDRACRSSS